MRIFFIPCLNESNMWMFPLMFAYMCFSCGDLDSVQVAFIKSRKALLLYLNTEYIFHSVCIVYTSIYWFVRVRVTADVIGFIIMPVR